MDTEYGRKNLLCRFLMRGYCRDGEDCLFSHDDHEALIVPEDICWYNLTGGCVFGDSCRFGHLDAPEICELLLGQPSSLQNSASSSFESQEPISNFTSQQSCLRNETDARSFDTKSYFDQQPTDHIPSGINLAENCLSNLSDQKECIENVPNPSWATLQSSSVHGKKFNISSTSSTKAFTPRQSGYNGLATSSHPPYQSSSKSYAQAARDKEKAEQEELMRANEKLPLCPLAMNSDTCPNTEKCKYLHGDLCELCSCLCLHPYNQKQRRDHNDECVREHEKQMEISFAIQRSIDKACGVCMDIIMEKDPKDRRFGILEKCTHIFCLNCIRQWRQTKQFENKTIRACPECRVSSDFVVPSRYWIDDKDEKERLISDYKVALSQKPCKYFKEGRGECPFAGACFYRHAYPDGSKADMPPPRPRRRQQNNDGDYDTLRDMLLWNYLEDREDPNPWLLALDLEEMMDMHDLSLYSDSDESDFSDYEAFLEA